MDNSPEVGRMMGVDMSIKQTKGHLMVEAGPSKSDLII